jgi:hypothetical protein
VKHRLLLALSLSLLACSGPAPRTAQGAAPMLERAPWQFDSLQVEAQRRPQDAWQAYPTRVLSADTVARVSPDRTGEYGGAQDLPAQRASGFFRVDKLANRWWLIDPAGQRFINAGVVAVNAGNSATNKAALKEHFGNTENWAREVAQWLPAQGFNGVGAWSDTKLLARPEFRTPHARIVKFMADYGKQRGGTFQQPGHIGYPNDAIFVFDPAFERFADEYAAKLESEASNPWLIGWFSDNELPLYDKSLERFLALPATEPGAVEAKRWLAERQGKAAPDLKAITPEDRSAFVGHVYATYLRIVSSALRRHDPNHLYLGSRLHSDELKNRSVFEAAGKYLDVISINYYRSWAPDAAQLQQWESWSGKPLLITEWYTKGADAGLANSSGAGWIVRNQTDRGRHYQNFVLNLLESRVVVGWHWFKYMDNDPADLTTDPSNRDANKGLVDIHYQPYLPLLEAAREINLRKYALIADLDGLNAPAPQRRAPADPYRDDPFRRGCYDSFGRYDPWCDPFYDPYGRRNDNDRNRGGGIPLPPLPLPGKKGWPGF